MKSSADTLSPHPKPYSTLIFIHTFFKMAYIMRRGEGRKEVSAAGPRSHRALGTTRSCACRPHKKRALCVLGLIRTCLFTRLDKLVIYAAKIQSYFVSCCHLGRGRTPPESRVCCTIAHRATRKQVQRLSQILSILCRL